VEASFVVDTRREEVPVADSLTPGRTFEPSGREAS
jgi:hypothetical protein